ncbi:MAG TPA: hypothetical protein VIK31_10495 [Propionibacteriaceae bacterium]
MTALAKDAGVELLAAHERVVARLFRPGDALPGESSRTESLMNRVLSMPPETIPALAQGIREDFGDRHTRLVELLVDNAAMVRGADAPAISEDLSIVLGAVFTAEFAVEGAALCSPSAVRHPDQSGLAAGELRVLLSVRSIGESHLSSIQFCEAIIGPGRTWTFLPRAAPLRLPAVTLGVWAKEHFMRSLEHHGEVGELVRSVGQALPEFFEAGVVEEALQGLRALLLHHAESRAQVDRIRTTASSAYRVTFPEDSDLTARVLLPVADEEQMGMEDARFVRFGDEVAEGYRATYTAYDGYSVASRLITTGDFRTFEVHRLIGHPTRTKGMALFPRRVGGKMLALSRGDGECISVSRSFDGLDWGPEEPVYQPEAIWEVVQSGNCGPPIETTEGWLVLTHGVGPMRVYSIGAILLDLDDPTRVRAILPGPLLVPQGADRTGYVPNVVYSCGAIVHDETLWIPYGVGDDRIHVASVTLSTLFDAFHWADPSDEFVL